jgi:penicillin-binding protein 1A
MAQLTKIATISLWLITSAITGFVLIACSAYLYLSPKLPSVDVLKDVQLQTPLRIYTADQQLIGEFGEKRRRPIGFEQIPPLFVDAILAIEDSRFYEHNGVDIKGLLRAVSQLLLTGQKGSGGSTITMQVAKNYFFSFEKTFSRKFNEILLAIQIEQELSKEEIFELYVNKIFLGKRAYGFEAAAQVYYGKSLTELDLAQLAMLAGLPQSPSVANPIINPERAMIRRNVVLGRMRQLGDIDMEQFQTAMKRPITASFHGTKVTLDVPYVAEMVRKNMLSRYGRAAYTDGYRVYTTLQSSLQNAANDAVLAGLTAYDKRHGYRGPEQNLPPVNDTDDNGESLAAEESPAVDDADTELDNVLTAELTQAQRTRQLWLSALAKSSSPDGFLPAIVTTVDEQAFSALLSDDSEVVVDWESGIQGTRRYLTVDSTSSPVKIAAELVAVGDLIRLRQKPDGSWYLTQLPDAQAALVSLDADNGAILSLVGGFNYNQSKFNRITQATRQPGSNFKPFIYTAALANGFTPASIINDAPIVFEDASLESTWRPTNDGGKFYGPTRLRRALFKSRNLVSIRLLRRLGIPTAIDYVANFGFDP